MKANNLNLTLFRNKFKNADKNLVNNFCKYDNPYDKKDFNYTSKNTYHIMRDILYSVILTDNPYIIELFMEKFNVDARKLHELIDFCMSHPSFKPPAVAPLNDYNDFKQVCMQLPDNIRFELSR